MELLSLVEAITPHRICGCHGEPMVKSGYQADGKQKYCCAIKARRRRRKSFLYRYHSDPEYAAKRKAQAREAYYNMSGFEYNLGLLRKRRQKALVRMKKRMEGVS